MVMSSTDLVIDRFYGLVILGGPGTQGRSGSIRR
jgi:hypothetical protein